MLTSILIHLYRAQLVIILIGRIFYQLFREVYFQLTLYFSEFWAVLAACIQVSFRFPSRCILNISDSFTVFLEYLLHALTVFSEGLRVAEN